MAEATQQFVPVQTQSVAPSVGAAPGMPQDTMLESVYNYAQKQNVANLQTAREEEYVEGQLLAAQNNGVKEVRKNQPWVYDIFGGGAALSGAMDYMEQTRLLEYQDDINNNMDEHRKLRPEDFKTQQLENIKQFYTDDDETNQHIMRTFGLALPNIVRVQTKEHEKFIQEKHLESMTKLVGATLRQSEVVRGTMDDDDQISADYAMEQALIKPAGMNPDAYKSFLYDQLQAASKTGDTAVAARIADMGLIQTPADIDLLDKAETTLLKYRAEKERFEYGAAVFEIEKMAGNAEIGDVQYALGVKQLTETYPVSPEKVTSLLRRRLTAKQNKSKERDTRHLTELFLSGNGFKVPHKDRQDIYSIAYEQGKKNPDDAKRFWVNMTATKDTAEVAKEGFRGRLNVPVQMVEGVPEISADASAVITELKMVRDLTRDNGNPGVFTKHMDVYTRELFNAYEMNEKAMPGAGEGVIMQAAMDSMAAHQGTDGRDSRLNLTTAQKQSVVDEIDGMGNFDSDVFTDQVGMSTALDAALKNLDISLPPKILAGRVEDALLAQYEENDDGIWIAKRDGKTVSQRSGIADPWERLKDYSNAELLIDGKSVVAQGVTYGLDGSRDAFRVYDNNTNLPIATISFDELKEWRSPKVEQKVVTPTNQAAYNKTVRIAKRRLTHHIENQLRDGSPREGVVRQLEKDDEYAYRVVGDMSEEEILTAYKQVVDTEGFDTSAGARAWDMIDSAQAAVGAAWDEFKVSVVDVGFANMLEAYGMQDKIDEARTTEHAKDFVEAIAQEETTLKEAAPTELTGAAAANAVQRTMDGTLTAGMRNLIKYEGFSEKEYDDGKGNMTKGVGLTGKYKDRPFEEVYYEKKEEVEKAVPSFYKLPPKLQHELIAANWRGDLRKTKWVKLFNAGKYDEAAVALFMHKELQEYLYYRSTHDKTDPDYRAGLDKNNPDAPNAGGNIPERFFNLRREIEAMR